MGALCRILLTLAVMVFAGNAAASPAAEVPVMPNERMDEQQLREQLERARVLNAELAAEQENLQKELADLEKEVAAKKRLLDGGKAGNVSPDETTEPWWRSPLADAALIVGAVLMVIGLVVYWRRRARTPA